MTDDVENVSSKKSDGPGTTAAGKDIAIIGMACLFPEAPDLQSFWQNILGHVDAVGEPTEAWDAKRYLDSGRIYTASGGYLRDLCRFDPKRFGIMPNSVDGGEPDQFLALQLASDALEDAGYSSPESDHQDTGVVLGHSTYLHRGQGSFVQHHIVLDQTLDLLEKMGVDLDDEQSLRLRNLLRSKLPPFNADTVPALVPNVMTGRIANRLNLRGPNYLIDAACSSSLLAVNAAIDELVAHRSRMMIAGGVNASLPAETILSFTQLGAVSKRGKVRPFELGSDGTLLGEGLGMVVLKRLEDALLDGDRVYAVIKGVGQSSDGKGVGLLAPTVEGELLAMRRAYDASGVDPASISLIEAHGTGIPLGDATEINALGQLLGERRGQLASVALGSVKSMISHCIPASGIAGLIKTALAIHHRILPPTLCETVNPDLGISATPLYVNNQLRPWLAEEDGVRRAGVNAFGFGGINTHAILEQAPAAAKRPATLSRWPSEVIMLSASEKDGLSKQVEQLSGFLTSIPDCSLSDIAYSCCVRDVGASHRLALVAESIDDLGKKLAQAQQRLQQSVTGGWAVRSGIYYTPEVQPGKVAFVFPGEGSQYRGMLEELSLHCDSVRQWFDFWRGLYAAEDDILRTDFVFPPRSDLDAALEALLTERLHDMDIGSEAVFIGGQAMYSALSQLGIAPDVMVGHSSGESSALLASGALKVQSRKELANYIRELNQFYRRTLADGDIAVGTLLAVGALTKSDVQEWLSDDVVLAMENCKNQLVLFGRDSAAMVEVEAGLTALGGICLKLPFDRGYHTKWFSKFSHALKHFYERFDVSLPDVPMYSCASADRFPDEVEAFQSLASSQWSTGVRFRETIQKMYADGVRYFVEVGPSGNLTAFINDILGRHDALALATNLQRKSDMSQYLKAIAQLYINDKVPDLAALFSARNCRMLDFSAPAPAPRPSLPLSNTMPIIRLDREELRAILPARCTDGGSRAAEIANDIAVGPASGENPSSVNLIVQDGEQQVMFEHFQLMREFLGGQVELLQAISEPRCEVDDRPMRISDTLPLISEVAQGSPDTLKALSRISLLDNNFLMHHVLSGPVSEFDPELVGLACVPLQVSLEILAEACAALTGRSDITVIEHVRAFDWITLENQEIELEATVSYSSNSRSRCVALLRRDGKDIVFAEFSFGEACDLPDISTPGELEQYFLPDHELYRHGMFHGPLFQSVGHIVGCGRAGIVARLSGVTLQGFLRDGETPPFLLNPVALDAVGQCTAYWTAQFAGTDFNNFPSTIGRIELYGATPSSTEGLEIRARQRPAVDTEDAIDAPRYWDFSCVDEQGRKVFRIERFENLYFPVPHEFYLCRRDPLNSWLGQPLEGITHSDALFWFVEHYSLQFCNQSGGIFSRILAHMMLDYDELSAWYSLSGGPSRSRDWLFGRIALKQAARFWIYKATGELLYPTDIRVMHDELGAPSIGGWWVDTVAEVPEVSLSHDKKNTIAVIAPPGERIGVDLERLGSIRHPEQVVNSFCLSEQQQLSGFEGEQLEEKVLRFWCAKESAAKYFGSGLQGEPSLFEVFFHQGYWSRATVVYGEQRVDIRVDRIDDAVLAIASDHHIHA